MGTKIGDITYKRGDTKPIRVTIINKATKLPADISACTFKLTVDPEKFPADDTNNLFVLDGVVAADQVLDVGKVQFEPSEVQSDNLGDYFYDIQMIDANGFKDTFAGPFKFKITQDITKA